MRKKGHTLKNENLFVCYRGKVHCKKGWAFVIGFETKKQRERERERIRMSNLRHVFVLRNKSTSSYPKEPSLMKFNGNFHTKPLCFLVYHN